MQCRRQHDSRTISLWGANCSSSYRVEMIGRTYFDFAERIMPPPTPCRSRICASRYWNNRRILNDMVLISPADTPPFSYSLAAQKVLIRKFFFSMFFFFGNI